MGPDLLERCPACAASVRPGAPWCTLCWTDLRPAPEPAPEPVAQHRPDPLTDPLPGIPPQPTPAATGGGWPCAACGTVNAVELDACSACGSGFLAMLKAQEEPLLVLPGVGDLTRMSRGARLGLAGGVVLLFVLLTAVLGLLLG